MSLARRAVAEGLGTALLLVAIVGSGVMGERLSGANVALALLANSVATGGALFSIICALAPISGAHLNPLVTIADATLRGIAWRDVPAYIFAQCSGAVLGVAVADAMFGLAPFAFSHHARAGAPRLLGETVATFGLLVVIFGCARARTPSAFPVAAYVVGAYWFTSSTSFANPAVTIARALTDTFAGIRSADVPPFVLAQSIGATLAVAMICWLTSSPALRTMPET